ncbi:hypothetical protein MNBD_GAMMA25-1543 [hydrothermal vent metagenome]|uniref:Cobalt transporter subunit CbtB (Proposed) n=1 Tax=hydrothermal vent metagenome TaxID=652676 RepID=A0A3B1AZQ9_9ZZZZ
MNLSATTRATSLTPASRLPAAIGASILGLFILFGVGFAQGQGDMFHNAAHDTRHTMVFPCH